MELSEQNQQEKGDDTEETDQHAEEFKKLLAYLREVVGNGNSEIALDPAGCWVVLGVKRLRR